MPTTIALIAHHAASLLNFRGEWIRDLQKRGVRVVCFAPDYTDTQRLAVTKLGAEPLNYSLQRTGMSPLRDVCDMMALTFKLKQLKPDIVFAFSTKPVIYGTLAAWAAGVRHRVAMIEGVGFVFTDSELPLSWKRQYLRKMVGGLYRLALRKAHSVIFLNQDDRQEFVSRRLVSAESTHVLGGIGVNLEHWAPAPLPHKPVTFLLVARLLREKGILEFVTAAKEVQRQHPGSARFVLLGGLDSNPGGLTHAEVQTWVDDGTLEWHGHTDVKPWIRQASVFVLPSWREGVPRSTQEAMAMGRPVITTDAPGCRETVVEGVNGYIVPIRDTVALAQAMIQFIQDPQRIFSMGAASRKLAEERFDVHHINHRLSRCVLGQPTSMDTVF